MGKSGLLDLENHFTFYGAYHSNPINILIHTLFVWPIFNHALVLNYGYAFSIFLCLFYVVLDKKDGSLAALLCLACWVGASFIAAKLEYSLAWKVNFCSFVVKYQP
ncbi:hypothetical protein E1A91_D08G177500v1 [Gossypium mustelinum]|uniref:Uncharacterized protein n=1 Tax=Gossypium mustelinum TaxID=34275 RepID=A0A5D2TZR3_GOSMU|nr:hypothetical protein E1A91_D08G177500v1 [Gossypium mustelinum]